MSFLSDEQMKEAYWNGFYSDGSSTTDGLRAVADAAIAADRAARAEPVAWIIQWDNDPDDVVTSMHNYDLQQALGAGWPIQYLYTAPPAAPVVPEDMSPANVPMYWRDESSNACAYAAGFNACRRAMLAAAPAEPSGNSGELPAGDPIRSAENNSAQCAPAGEQVGLTDAWHVGWAVLASNGNIRIWHKEKADAEASQRKYGGELVRLTTIAPAEPVFPGDIRDALMSAFRVGSISGHERTVEGYWSDDVDELAGELADSLLSCMARPQPVAVPDGMVLVPVEPTEEMHRAGLNACDDTWISDTRQVNARVYRAMLAAAPATHSCSENAENRTRQPERVDEIADREHVPARWYMVNKDGAATLCVDQVDALKEAADANLCWPHLAPHQAVLLGPAHDFSTMIERGTKAWADTPDNWLEELRGDEPGQPAKEGAR